MPNQYSNSNLGDLVRLQGEQLARLTVIVDRHDEEIDKQNEALDLVASAVDRLVTRDEFKSRFMNVVIPLLSSVVGVLAGHFLLH